MSKEHPTLKVGILGCGPIAQFAHFESCQKAKNVELYAICDAAADLLQRMQAIWQPAKAFLDFDQMLADPELEAVIIATSDAFHVPLSLKAVQAGKHVLVEKPLSHDIEACLVLEAAARKSGVVVQVGHMKRFDAGIEYAQTFVKEKLGELLALKAWYGDNTHRYTMTDNVQPLPIKSQMALKPKVDEKADLERYYMMAHGSHLLDTAYFLGGPIGCLSAKLRQKFNAYCWFVDVEFENGAIGHLDLTIKLRGDWHEGFQVYGEHGSVFAKTYNPWFYKSSDVECFLEAEQQYYRPLGADGFSYRRQLEHFADVILHQVTPKGTSILEGLEVAKGMIAIKRSVDQNKPIYLDQIKANT
ncbi:MAG: Gfo/Idh/MocA family oxidoreductase [Saprospiraceae bacterium]